MFRPDRVYKRCSVVAEADGVEIKRWGKPVLTPGEMVEVTLPADAERKCHELKVRIVEA
jgi:hypothetical protein